MAYSVKEESSPSDAGLFGGGEGGEGGFVLTVLGAEAVAL